MPGYEAKFIHQLLKRHECPICLFAMKNPVQTECGHLFCRECLDPVLKRRYPICPLDKEEISPDGIFPDNACRREILNLGVQCNFHSGGCTWTGHLKELEGHLKDCEYREMQCTQCGQYIQCHSLDVHQEKDCPMRPENCKYCGKDIPYQQMEDHIQKKCPDVYHSCPNECDSTLQMKLPELEKHISLRSGTCPLSEVECPYTPYGCLFVSQRKNIEKHISQHPVYHARLQSDSFFEMKQTFEKTSASVQHILERVSSLESRTNAIERLQDAIETRVGLLDERREHALDRYERKIESIEDETTRLNDNVSELSLKVDEIRLETALPHNTAMSLGYGTGNIGALSTHINASGRMGAMNMRSTNLTSLASHGSSLTPLSSGGIGSSSTITPQRIESIHSRLVEVEQSVDRSVSSCLDQELRIQLLERATYNGILLWKIDEFARRRKEAIDGVTMSLYSTPFYTGRHGYKMCARIYLNGDGLGKNSHVSFFFVIMRGPIDELLPWPFKQKVTLTLINQEGKKHVTDSFRPDPHSSSFQRPGRREMNIASGCPMFIRQELLLNGGFVKDDSIYIRVMVETSDLPKIFPM